MKALYFALALMLTGSAPAAHLHYRHRRPRCPVTVTRKVGKVPWKTIVAGGAAAGTMIAAYKISNGVEQKLKKPASTAFWNVNRTALLALLAALGLVLIRFQSFSHRIIRLSKLVFHRKKRKESL